MTETDRYEVLDVVGTGGMATVWRARDRSLERVVALKRPHPAPSGSEVHARFGREARMAAAVSHPNLVEVFDVGRDDVGPYLVMEFVDAPSLAEADVGPDDAARVGAEVAAGLAALHAAGIVHRDVKPANVLLPSGGAKLTDFGIARAVDATTLTQPHLTHATPAYAAPEVLASGDHSAASDVYALAAVVAEVLTGSRDPATRTPLLDQRWRAALEPALSATAGDRPTAAEFASSLRRLADGAPAASSTATVPMTAAAAGAGSSPGATTTVWSPAEPRPEDAHRREARTAMAIFGALLAVAAIVIFVATRADDEGAVAESQPSVQSTPSTQPAGAVAASTTAMAAPPVTTSAATEPTAVPTTVPPTAAIEPLPGTSGETLSALLGVVDDAGVLGQGRPRDQFEERLEQAIEEAADAEDGDDDRDDKAVRDRLKDATKEVAKRTERADERDEILRLMTHLAEQLGVDPQVVTDAFAKSG